MEGSERAESKIQKRVRVRGTSLISVASAAVLAAGGIVLLFASDVVLRGLVPGYPAGAAWIGQLLGASWLGLAALNWLNRSSVLGGIYGRPVVCANLTLYFVGMLVVLKAAAGSPSPGALWVIGAVLLLFAVVYGWLLFRGPIEREH